MLLFMLSLVTPTSSSEYIFINSNQIDFLHDIYSLLMINSGITHSSLFDVSMVNLFTIVHLISPLDCELAEGQKHIIFF